MIVFSACRKVNWKMIKTLLNSKKVELATEEEVFKITQCIPGAVPPFGNIFGI